MIQKTFTLPLFAFARTRCRTATQTTLILMFTALPLFAAAAEDVVVTIKPLHSLVQGVMGDTAKAGLLLGGNTSPHVPSLKPSQIKMLHDAKLVFYIDDSFELFLPKIFATLPPQLRKIPVTRADLTLLEKRQGGAWEAHARHHNGHDHHGHHDRQDHDASDMHLWLDADNANKVVALIVTQLAADYPQHRDTYQRNARALTERIDALDAKLKTRLAAIKNKPFIVFHDAYQYFERRYGLNGVGAVTLEPGDALSINRLKQLGEKIKATGAVCAFKEPQFPAGMEVLARENDIKIAMLDPIGADLTPGPGLYFSLLENLASELLHCLN